MENKTLMTFSERQLHDVIERIVIYCGLMPVVIIFGVFGNIMTLVILFKEKDLSTTSIYIKTLAVTDLQTLLTRGAVMFSIWWQVFWPEKYILWTVNSASLYLLSTFPEKISRCITVVIVFDRIIAVKWPYKYKSICTPRRAIISMIVIYSVFMITSFPIIADAFIYLSSTTAKSITQEYPTTDSERDQYMAARALNSDVIRIFHTFTRVIEFALILVTVVGNVAIVHGMRKGAVINPTLNTASEQRQRQQRQITKLCLTVSFTFLFLWGPSDIYVFLVLTERMKASNCIGYNIFGFLSTLNSAVNFVIYAVTHTKYRKAYFAILPCTNSTAEDANQDSRIRNVNVTAIANVSAETDVWYMYNKRLKRPHRAPEYNVPPFRQICKGGHPVFPRFRPENYKLVRRRRDLASCQVSLNSLQQC